MEHRPVDPGLIIIPKFNNKNHFIPHFSSVHVDTSLTNSNLPRVEWCANPDTLVSRGLFTGIENFGRNRVVLRKVRGEWRLERYLLTFSPSWLLTQIASTILPLAACLGQGAGGEWRAVGECKSGGEREPRVHWPGWRGEDGVAIGTWRVMVNAEIIGTVTGSWSTGRKCFWSQVRPLWQHLKSSTSELVPTLQRGNIFRRVTKDSG
jgi:hypothetical protein